MRYFWPEAKSAQSGGPAEHIRTAGHQHDLDFAAFCASHRRLREEVAALQVELRFRRFFRNLKAGFNPDQPRDDHGRWTNEGGDDNSNGNLQTPVSNESATVAQIEMGVLLGQALVHPSHGGGKDCFYQFSYGIVAIRWSANFACAPTLPWFAATHGRLIR